MFHYKVLKFNHTTKEIEFWDIGPTLYQIYKDFPNPCSYTRFKKLLHDRLLSQFWKRCEYEVVVSDWPNQTQKRKIDIFEQIKENWDFIAWQAYQDFYVEKEVFIDDASSEELSET